MYDLLEVREYDSVIGNPDYADDPDYKHMHPAIFAEFLRFVRGFSHEDSSDAPDFFRISYRKPVGDVVTVKNYVGLIQLPSGYKVQILPKIYFPEDESASEKRVFLNMLRSLRDFPGKAFGAPGLDTERINLYEIFIRMYLSELQKLTKTGLKASYTPREENLRFFKGKLMPSRQMTENTAHAERFFVAYDEFNTNCAENRIIKATLLKLRRLTDDIANVKSIQQLLGVFDTVEASDHYARDFARVSLDRTSERYRRLMQWSEVFLLGRSFTPFCGSTEATALLFPMERVYEDYITRQVKSVLCPEGWDVSAQATGHYLFTEPRNRFAIRPDLVCTRNGRIIVMDTKWKCLIPDESRNYGISQSDMYQMYAYSKKYNAPEVWLLYPLNRNMPAHRDTAFRSGDGTAVHVFLVDLVHIDESMAALHSRLKDKNR